MDDEPGVRSALSGVLRDEGYIVDAVESGEQCLDRVVREVVRRHRARRVAARARRPRDARPPAADEGGFAGRHDLGPRQHRVGGEGDQDGRVRLRREAAVAREDGARHPQRAAAAAPRSREPRAARARRSRRQDGGREPPHAAAARAGGDGRADQRPRADFRRERHRQGARRAHRARAEPPAQSAVRRGQLRRDSRRADRERAVRPREGRVHRRRRRSQGKVRGRAQRDDLSRRNRRHEHEDAGEGAARAAGAGDRAGRQHVARAGGCAGAGRHQQGSARRRSARDISARTCTSG